MFNSSPSVIEIFISFFPISTCSVHPRKFILNVYLFHLVGNDGVKAKHIVFYLHSGEAVNVASQLPAILVMCSPWLSSLL